MLSCAKRKRQEILKKKKSPRSLLQQVFYVVYSLSLFDRQIISCWLLVSVQKVFKKVCGQDTFRSEMQKASEKVSSDAFSNASLSDIFGIILRLIAFLSRLPTRTVVSLSQQPRHQQNQVQFPNSLQTKKVIGSPKRGFGKGNHRIASRACSYSLCFDAPSSPKNTSAALHSALPVAGWSKGLAMPRKQFLQMRGTRSSLTKFRSGLSEAKGFLRGSSSTRSSRCCSRKRARSRGSSTSVYEVTRTGQPQLQNLSIVWGQVSCVHRALY